MGLDSLQEGRAVGFRGLSGDRVKIAGWIGFRLQAEEGAGGIGSRGGGVWCRKKT